MEIDFKLLFESSPSLFMVLDPNFNIIALSDQYVAATMIQRDYAIGRGLFEVFPDNPNDPNATGTRQLRASIERALASKKQDTMAVQKYDIRRPDGSFEERHWTPLNLPVLGSDGSVKYIIHKAEDVTEFVKLKHAGIELSRTTEKLKSEKDDLEKLRQSQRMEAMGQLAGGVAHDFNNILATITVTCETALLEDNLTEKAKSSLSLVLENSERAASLTRQLLAFSRKQVLQPKLLQINSVIENFKSLLPRLLNENIRIHIDLADDLGQTLIDPGQVEQIILNLVVNARDAMPRGGSISIWTENVDLDTSMASGNMNVDPGKYVMIAVRDTGSGMSAATQARLFEPFFTTKPLGRGTGLGLATVYGIVKQNKGTIWVYSELQKGTVFKIYLPYQEDEVEAEETTETVAPFAKAKTDRRTVLIAEDEIQLRTAMRDTLKAHDYRVFEAENGLQVLDILTANPGKIDLIITDVVMPEMGGQELTRRLGPAGYNGQILYLSGYTQDVLDTHGIQGEHHFLEKPFRLKVLLSKISEILDLK